MGDKKQSDDKKKKGKLFSGLWQKLSASKYGVYVVAGVLGLVVVAIFISSCSSESSEPAKDNLSQTSTQVAETVESYSESLEHRLENVLGSVKGCFNVKVMVVAESTPIITLAEQVEEKTTGSGENKTITKYPVYVEDGSSKTPMILYQSAPQIRGVLIVAKGAGDANVKLQLISAVTALLGIESSKIEVLEGN